MRAILRLQKDFFTKGGMYLKPMTLKDVAAEINMHESTISRTVNNKYVQTSQGVLELKYFFNSSVRRISGSSITSTSVQNKIKQIIKNENPDSPFSDEKIVKILKAENIRIARRTVGKYRDVLGIPSTTVRRIRS